MVLKNFTSAERAIVLESQGQKALWELFIVVVDVRQGMSEDIRGCV